MRFTAQHVTHGIDTKVRGRERGERERVGCLVGCLMSQQHASVSQGRICTDDFTCCHTEIEVADQTFYLTQSQFSGERECVCVCVRAREILVLLKGWLKLLGKSRILRFSCFILFFLQHPYGMDIQSQNADEIISFVKRHLRNTVSNVCLCMCVCVCVCSHAYTHVCACVCI